MWVKKVKLTEIETKEILYNMLKYDDYKNLDKLYEISARDIIYALIEMKDEGDLTGLH